MAAFLEPLSFEGREARLVPLTPEHHDDLVEAVRDGELWKLWYTTAPAPEGMRTDIERRIAAARDGSSQPFAVIDAKSAKAVGMTSFLNADAANRRLEIGATWYRKSRQRTGLNTECKLLLLAHAFEAKQCIAVEFRTHLINRDSRRGIERLGAKLDGILRHHRIMANGTLRDTCVYSIIAPEWPMVKANLEWQIAKPRGPAV
jgi:N-acetyltransferase